MEHPDPEVLAGLALGDGWSDGHPGTADADRQHVATCASCTEVVAELRRTLEVTAHSGERLEAPHPDVWGRIDAALDLEAAGTRSQDRPEPAPARPDPVRRLPRPRRSRTLAWAAAAAVLGILAGIGGAWSFWRAPDPGPTTIASVQLDTLDTKQSRGEAALERRGDQLDLRVATTSLDPGSGYLEVWLLNADGKRMVSVGVLRTPGTDTFPVSQALIDKGYVVVDVSREGFDDKPQHSGDSLVRGRLAV